MLAKLNTKIFDELTIFYVFFQKLSIIANNKKNFYFFFPSIIDFFPKYHDHSTTYFWKGFRIFRRYRQKRSPFKLIFQNVKKILGFSLGFFLGKVK